MTTARAASFKNTRKDSSLLLRTRQVGFNPRNDITAVESQFTSLIDQRNDADNVSLEKCNLVINAVKGDPSFGEDSALYESMGYVRMS